MLENMKILILQQDGAKISNSLLDIDITTDINAYLKLLDYLKGV